MMNGFFMSPFSVPIAGIALAAFAILVSGVVKVNKARIQSHTDSEGLEEELRGEIGRLRSRVEALESIVLNLDKRVP